MTLIKKKWLYIILVFLVNKIIIHIEHLRGNIKKNFEKHLNIQYINDETKYIEMKEENFLSSSNIFKRNIFKKLKEKLSMKLQFFEHAHEPRNQKKKRGYVKKF